MENIKNKGVLLTSIRKISNVHKHLVAKPLTSVLLEKFVHRYLKINFKLSQVLVIWTGF
jgi:hypothetical protein